MEVKMENNQEKQDNTKPMDVKEAKQESLKVIGLGEYVNLETGNVSYVFPPDPGLALLFLRDLEREVNMRVDRALQTPKKNLIQRVNPFTNMKKFVMNKKGV